MVIISRKKIDGHYQSDKTDGHYKSDKIDGRYQSDKPDGHFSVGLHDEGWHLHTARVCQSEASLSRGRSGVTADEAKPSHGLAL